MPKLLTSVVLLPFVMTATAQINYSGGAYAQDFDSLGSGVIWSNCTVMPSGWVVSRGSYVWTTVTNGYSNNYGTYCFSLMPGDPDKSIGLVIGSTGQAYLGASFRNTTDATLTSFSLSYFAEQWAKGAISLSDQAIPFSYSLNASSLTSGTFVNVPSLDMHSINDGNGTFSALNGNLAANRQQVVGTVSGISWRPNEDLWIRWSGISHPFLSSHALAVDDLFFQAVPELRVSMIGAQFRMSWPTNYGNWRLESAPTPAETGWEVVTNVAVAEGGEFSIEVPRTGAQQFFRLRKQ